MVRVQGGCQGLLLYKKGLQLIDGNGSPHSPHYMWQDENLSVVVFVLFVFLFFLCLAMCHHLKAYQPFHIMESIQWCFQGNEHLQHVIGFVRNDKCTCVLDDHLRQISCLCFFSRLPRSSLFWPLSPCISRERAVKPYIQWDCTAGEKDASISFFWCSSSP